VSVILGVKAPKPPQQKANNDQTVIYHPDPEDESEVESSPEINHEF